VENNLKAVIEEPLVVTLKFSVKAAVSVDSPVTFVFEKTTSALEKADVPSKAIIPKINVRIEFPLALKPQDEEGPLNSLFSFLVATVNQNPSHLRHF